ncbi:MAG TPA: hypothetical protein VF559_05890 [Caulobacteraceae bacterium]
MPTQLDKPTADSHPGRRKMLTALPIALVLIAVIVAAVAAWSHHARSRTEPATAAGADRVMGRATPEELASSVAGGAPPADDRNKQQYTGNDFPEDVAPGQPRKSPTG